MSVAIDSKFQDIVDVLQDFRQNKIKRYKKVLDY